MMSAPPLPCVKEKSVGVTVGVTVRVTGRVSVTTSVTVRVSVFVVRVGFTVKKVRARKIIKRN